VIKIDGNNLPMVAIGDSNAMRVGDLVLAVVEAMKTSCRPMRRSTRATPAVRS
jgi:hypothetical protein